MSYHYSPKIVTNGLIYYLDFANTESYAGSGTSCSDLTGINSLGTLTNGPTFSSSNLGSIGFDGVDDYITTLSNSILNPTSSITVCAWSRYNGTYGGNYAPIVFKRNQGVSYFEQFQLAYSGGGNVQIAIGNSSINTNESATTTGSYTNQLNYAVGVVDIPGGTLKIYVDGVLNNTHNLVSITSMETSNNPLIVGGNAESFAGYMGGNIFNVKIYNRALAATEISQNFLAMKKRFGL